MMIEPRTKDVQFLIDLSEILQEDDAPSFVLEKAYAHVFLDIHGRNRIYKMSDPREWHERQLFRMLHLILEIVPRYTQLFQNPQAIPVTHYKRQKTLSIYLDEQFAKVLHERVRRSNVPGMMDEQGGTIPDPVLDAPILDLKQEARSKNFPKNKKGAVVSLKKLEERFESKLLGKGIRLTAQGPDEEAEERFTYGP
jgi:hypothetical protein